CPTFNLRQIVKRTFCGFAQYILDPWLFHLTISCGKTERQDFALDKGFLISQTFCNEVTILVQYTSIVQGIQMAKQGKGWHFPENCFPHRLVHLSYRSY